MEQLQTLWQRAKENSGSDEGFQLLKDAFSPNKQYLLSIVSEIQQFPHYVKPLVVYLSENFPDYEVLGQLLTNVVDSDRNEVTGDLIRELFEMTVEAVGLDIFTGISIWQKYAEFELDNFEDYLAHLKEDSSMDLRSLNKAKQNITKVYLRQLSLPLVGNDSALTQFQEILSQYYSESDIDIIQPTTLETNFLGASKMLEERLPFEMKIYDEAYRSLTKSEQLMIWEEYITFELRQNKVDRLNRLYERLLLQFSEDVEIWLAYCGCTLCFQHDFLLTTKVVKRGLMVHYYDLLLRRTLLLSINFRQIRLLESGLIHSKEQANVEINSLRANFVETLAVGFSQAEEYLDFYFTFINCTRRLLCQMMIAKNNCALDALLFVKDEFMSSISELQQFLLNYYPQWKLAWETLAFYQSHQIYSIISPLEKHLRTSEEFPRAEIWTKTSFECNYELWHFSLQQNFSDYTSYQYFINQLINIKDYNSVSYVYRQLYADRTRQIMDKKSIVKDWMKFEENYRDMNEFTATLAKFFPKISDICSKSIPSVILTSNLKDVNVKEKKGSRKRDRIGESEEDDEGKVSKTKRYKVQFQTEIKNESKIEEEKLNAFVPSTVQGDAGFKDIKTNIVCIKNFPYAAPANKIYDFIRSILPYQRIEMIFTKAGNSRGMVNVEYKDSSEIVKLLSLKDLLVYEERPLEIECNVPSLLNFDPQIFCTIFVNHLPQEFSEEQLIDYFSSCGAVSKIKLTKDKKSELKKGSALILFDSVESRNKALLLNKSSFLGQEITVLPSKFAIVETNAASDSLLTEIVDIPKSNPRSNLVTSFAPRSVRRKKIQTEN